MLYELEKHVEDGVEYVVQFRREDIPSQGLMTPRLLRHSVDIHLARKLIQQNEELKRRVDALERQNAALLTGSIKPVVGGGFPPKWAREGKQIGEMPTTGIAPPDDDIAAD